jgi:hypothetical protein
LEQFRVPA